MLKIKLCFGEYISECQKQNIVLKNTFHNNGYVSRDMYDSKKIK